MKIRNGVIAFSALSLFVGTVVGCATEAVVVDPPDDGVVLDSSTPDTGKVDSSKPDTGRPDTSTPDSARPDTSTPDSSTPDSADAAPTTRPGDPFDPLAPKAGDMCPAGVQVNDVISRRCGKCGTQSALCETGRIVGAYGACTNEKTNADACLPGEVIVSECGFCGYQVKRCDNTCSYTEGACLNQVAGGCTKGEVTYLEGICANPTDVRKQTCSQACVKGTPEPCAARPIDEITVSQTAGMIVTGNFATTGTLKAPLLSTGTCPVTESATVQSLYHYVRIKNTGADEVTITVANGIPAGATRPAVTMAAYPAAPTATIPTDRKACAGSVTTTSPEKLTIRIPANSSVMVHTMLDTSAATQAKLALEVKTNFVGPETNPAPQYTIDSGANAGDIVNQSIAFGADTLPRPSGIVGLEACPLTLTTIETAYSYIRVNNMGAADRTVTLATTGGTDTVLAYYNGPAPISSNRTACTGNWIEDGIDETLSNVTIPAMGYITVLVARYSGTGGSSNLRVTTN